MMAPGRRWRWTTAGALSVYVVGVGGMLAIELTPRGVTPDFTVAIVAGFAVALGLLIACRQPASPVSAALVFLVAAPTFVSAVEAWGASYGSDGQMFAAQAVTAYIAPGVWVFNFAGFVMLCATFPSGLLPGRRWRLLPWAFCCAAVLVVAVVAIQPGQYSDGGGPLPGAPPFDLPVVLNILALLLAAALLLAVLAGAVASLVIRYRHGDELTRVQLRWLMLGSGSVSVLLVAGWVGDLLGASTELAYTPFMLGILVLVPTSVAVAIFRHDLLDIDRVLNDAIAWALTTAASAAGFALVVGIAQSGISRTRVGEGGGLVVAAFVTASVLTPMHRWFQHFVGSVVDRDRVVVLAAVRQFVDRVRDGQAEPEEVEHVLSDCLDDPQLRVLLRLPGRDELTGLDGEAYDTDDDAASISLESRGTTIGALRLGRTSSRRIRRAREAAIEARLAIDVSRLRLELRQALDDARSSRLRLVEAAAIERRRLERDLHDGAQQRIVAVGMRLRSVQRRHSPGDPTNEELDLAVNTLESIVDELRRLAHGMRPSMLDDGLEVALQALVAESPVSVQVDVAEMSNSEAAVTTAYFVVAEALANALKHADATSVHVRVGPIDGRLGVEVCDDGVGGARSGFGLTALRDRVAALDGQFDIDSPAGAGTRIRVTL